MSRRIAITAVMLLAATACTTTSSSSDSKPSPSPSSTGLAAEWGPKLQQATTADTGICNAVGDHACAEHLTDIALTVSDLESAVTDAGGQSVYPQTTALIEKNDTAVAAYTDHECLGDDNAGIPGSPCPDDVQTILSTAAALPLALQADET
jgi:hypothetical protein